MGGCAIGKNADTKRSKPSNKQMISHFYKAKISSKKLICYKPESSSFWEVEAKMNYMFQTGSLVCRLNKQQLIFIGGTESDSSFILNLESLSALSIKSPPSNIAYGALHIFQNKVYVVGAITVEEETPAPSLIFNLTNNTWHELPPMPVSVALSGSFKLRHTIYLIGGFLNYPESPSPFKSILLLDLPTSSWSVMNVETPIRHGIPHCTVLGENAILIVGGHDPFDRCEVVESRAVYTFNGEQFIQEEDLPENGQLHFLDPGLHIGSEILIYSEDEILFKFHLITRKWSHFDTEKIIQPEPTPHFRSSGVYAYHYLQENCEILCYNLRENVFKKTGPSSFQYFSKDAGFCVLPDGKLFFAGGHREDGITDECWGLEPEIRSSTKYPALPCQQYGLRLLSIGREVFGVAGVDNQRLPRCQKFSIDDQSWTEIPSMPYYTYLPGCTYFAGKIYCMGGFVEDQGTVHNFLVQTYVIDGHWSTLSVEYPLGVVLPGLAPMSANKLLCFGGSMIHGNIIKSCYLFDGDRFSRIQDFPEVEDREGATTFQDPVCVASDAVYAFSKMGALFRYDMRRQDWSVISY